MAYPEGAKTAATKDNSPLQAALYAQDEALRGLELNVETLEKALQPILRRAGISDGTESEAKDMISNSPIVEEVKLNAVRIETAVLRIQMLLSTLEV